MKFSLVFALFRDKNKCYAIITSRVTNLKSCIAELEKKEEDIFVYHGDDTQNHVRSHAEIKPNN